MTTTSPYHIVKNAQTAYRAVERHPQTVVVDVDQSLGKARLAFRMTDDANGGTWKGLDLALTSSGWEETDDSELLDTLIYEWRKTALSDHECVTDDDTADSFYVFSEGGHEPKTIIVRAENENEALGKAVEENYGLVPNGDAVRLDELLEDDTWSNP